MFKWPSDPFSEMFEILENDQNVTNSKLGIILMLRNVLKLWQELLLNIKVLKGFKLKWLTLNDRKPTVMNQTQQLWANESQPFSQAIQWKRWHVLKYWRVRFQNTPAKLKILSFRIFINILTTFCLLALYTVSIICKLLPWCTRWWLGVLRMYSRGPIERTIWSTDTNNRKFKGAVTWHFTHIHHLTG